MVWNGYRAAVVLKLSSAAGAGWQHHPGVLASIIVTARWITGLIGATAVLGTGMYRPATVPLPLPVQLSTVEYSVTHIVHVST
eukprot:COSAG02_NODE_919_length_15936_cov_5.055314_3_plen_83_part_00